MLFVNRLQSSGHILGLTFCHKLVLTVSNWVLNCGSRHKLLSGQSKLLWIIFWYAALDWCQSRRHIYRAVTPWCAMRGDDCFETWKMELVCAQIDHRSLFLLKTPWQQSLDVLLDHSVLQHPRESVDHSGHHHRSCGMCCTSYLFGVIILQ